LSASIANYVALKRALGRKFAVESRVLADLERFLIARGLDDAALTPESFAAWCLTFTHLCPTTRRNRMRIVRNLCLYVRRTHAESFVPDPATFPAPQSPKRPYIFSEDDIVQLFDEATDAFGRIDAVVNNAGLLHRASRLDEMSAERFAEVTRVNVIGALIVAREAVRRMSTRHGGDGGAIVNVSSAASYLGSPNEYIDYAATKGAMDTMTIGLAREVATEGVRVNAVRPGLIHTDIHQLSGIENRIDVLSPNVPMQRGGQPDEVAEAILWLASDAASYVTGTFIDTTGGR